MASVLYYGLDVNHVSDQEFDEWCKAIRHGWAKLPAVLKWQLDSPDKVEASGFHIKATFYSVCAAHRWADLRFPIQPTAPWQVHPKYGRWLPVGHFQKGDDWL